MVSHHNEISVLFACEFYNFNIRYPFPYFDFIIIEPFYFCYIHFSHPFPGFSNLVFNLILFDNFSGINGADVESMKKMQRTSERFCYFIGKQKSRVRCLGKICCEYYVGKPAPERCGWSADDEYWTPSRFGNGLKRAAHNSPVGIASFIFFSCA